MRRPTPGPRRTIEGSDAMGRQGMTKSSRCAGVVVVGLCAMLAGPGVMGQVGRTLRQAPWRGETLCPNAVITGYEAGPNISLGPELGLGANVLAIDSNQVTTFGRGTVNIYRRIEGRWALERRLFNEPTDVAPAQLYDGVAADGDAVVIAGGDALSNFLRLYRYDSLRRAWAMESTLRLVETGLQYKFDHLEFDGNVLALQATEMSQGELVRRSVVLFRYFPAIGAWDLIAILPISAAGNTGGAPNARYFRLHGDTVVTGYPLGIFDPDTGPVDEPGFVQVYRRADESDTWRRIATIVGEAPGFGRAMATSGDDVAITSPGSGAGPEVHVYRPIGHIWRLVEVIAPPAGETFDSATRLAMQGDDLFVSGSLIDAHGDARPMAYRYRRRGSGWTLVERVIGPMSDPPSGVNVEARGEFVTLSGFDIQDEFLVPGGSAAVFGGLAGADCNGNGLPDVCEFVDGGMADCNLNGVPDECEADCNANGIVDECELTQVRADSGLLGPIGAGAPVSFVVEAAPRAEVDVRIDVEAVADLAGPMRTIGVRLNGFPLVTLFEDETESCAGATAMVEYPASLFNFIVGLDPDGAARFELVASSDVDAGACGGSSARLRVSYEGDTGLDADGNGVPDECDAPTCEGLAATVYVDRDGVIVGGPLGGLHYFGVLIGTARSDVIVGTPGNDFIVPVGNAADDVVCGGGGDDRIIATGGDKPASRGTRPVGGRRDMR